MTVPVPGQLVYSDSGDGVTTTFSFPVRFLDKAEVVVLLRDVATGVDTKQVLGSDYTIAGSSWPTGGNIVFNTAPPVGTEVIRYRETVAKQVVDLANTQRNDAEAVETQLDRLAMVQQDQKQELARALKADFGEDGLTVERIAEGHFWLAGPGGRMVDGGSAEDIINAQGYAAEAKDAQAAAEAAQQGAEDAAERAEDAAERAEDAADRAESAAAGVEYPVSYAPQTLTPEQQEQARENIGIASDVVADRTKLKALDASKVAAAYLTETGRERQYILRDASEYTAEIAAADGQGYFIVSDDDPTKVWAAPLHKEIILTELGADPTRTNYSDDALGAAIAISQARGCIPIIVPPGRYKVAGNYTMGPVPIRGVNQGTAPLLNPTFYWDGAGTFLKWDGGDVAFNGTGGGIENAIIYRTGSSSGGVAVELYVTDDDYRAGEVKIKDVLITGESVGGNLREWETGLLVDGRNANTSGSRGVRTVLLDNLRVARCSENNKYVHFRQVTHLVGNLNIDQASGTGTPGITFDDFWDEVYLKVRGGNVIVNHSGDPDVDTGIDMLLDGVSLIGLDVNYKGIRGNFTGTVLGNITNAAPNFRINSHKADSATATLVTGTSNMTGDGTTVNMTFDTELIDTNDNFSSSTYFAKCAGVHEIAGHLTLNGLTNDHKTVGVRVSRITSGGSLIDETRAEYNAANMRQMDNIVSVPFYRRMYMEEGELARVRYTVTGGSKTVGQVGHATSQFNFFSARLI